jgi:hypothetical protein
MLKRLAPKGDLFFLHYVDVLPPDGGDRFTQHARTMTAATGSLNLNPGKRFKFD